MLGQDAPTGRGGSRHRWRARGSDWHGWLLGQDAPTARGGHLSRTRCQVMDTESGAPDADVAVARVCMVFMAVMEWLAGGRSASAIQVWILLQVLDYIHNDEHNRIRQNLMMRSHSELSNARFVCMLDLYIHIYGDVWCVWEFCVCGNSGL